jgi:hypothetical protein
VRSDGRFASSIDYYDRNKGVRVNGLHSSVRKGLCIIVPFRGSAMRAPPNGVDAAFDFNLPGG